MKNIIAISGKIGSGKDFTARIIQVLVWYHKNKEKTNFDPQNIRFVIQDSEWNKLINPFRRDCGWEVKKFADKLKDIVCMLTGCTREQLESAEFKNSVLPDSYKYIRHWNGLKTVRVKPFGEMADRGRNMTYREFLQYVGTELMRDQIHENVHVNALFADFKSKFAEEDGFVHTEYAGNKVMYKDHPIFEPSHYPNWIITDCRFPNEADAVKAKGGVVIRINRIWATTQEFHDKILGVAEHPSETALDNYKFDDTITNDGSIQDLIDQVEVILLNQKIITK